MTDLAVDGSMRELTSEELALVAGGGTPWGPSPFGTGESAGKAAGTDVKKVVKIIGEGAEADAGAVVGFFKGLF